MCQAGSVHAAAGRGSRAAAPGAPSTPRPLGPNPVSPPGTRRGQGGRRGAVRAAGRLRAGGRPIRGAPRTAGAPGRGRTAGSLAPRAVVRRGRRRARAGPAPGSHRGNACLGGSARTGRPPARRRGGTGRGSASAVTPVRERAVPQAFPGAVWAVSHGPDPRIHRHSALNHGIALAGEVDGEAEAVHPVRVHRDDDCVVPAGGLRGAPPWAVRVRVGTEEDDFVA